MRTFRFYWDDGQINESQGIDAIDAFSRLGSHTHTTARLSHCVEANKETNCSSCSAIISTVTRRCPFCGERQ